MTTKIKKYLFLFLVILPFSALGADGDIPSRFNFFTPASGDFSITLLERMFGSIGNVLHGSGNQIVGTLMGIFNALWVTAIGVAIFVVMWQSVIDSAHSGEMMGGKGKKTVFMIMRIVIGFCLVAPSQTTGYSLAQNGVIWVVVQGVGLADRVSSKLYTYLQEGGLAVQNNPTTAAEMMPLMPLAANMIKGQVCMYKLQNIVDGDKKARDDALKDNPGAELPPSGFGGTDTTIGYSINEDNSITMGSRNTKYNADDPTSHLYNSECGTIAWSVSIEAVRARLSLAGRDSEATIRSAQRAALNYMRQGVSEMFFNLQSVSKSLAGTNAEENNETAYKALADRGGLAMAGSGMTYVTLLDPVRQQTLVARDRKAATMLSDLYSKGWVYAPLMVILPGMVESTTTSVVTDYSPTVKAVDPLQLTGGIWESLKDTGPNSKVEMAQLLSKVDDYSFVAKANDALIKMNANNSWVTIDFQKILQDNITDGNDLSKITGYVEMAMSGANWTLDVAKGASNMGHDAAIWTFETIQSLVDGIKSVIDGVSDLNPFSVEEVGAMGGSMGSIIDYLRSSNSTANNAMNSAKNGLNGVASDIKNGLTYSRKGGMTDSLADLTSKAGPMGPVMAALMTNMVGHGMENLQNNLFSGRYNALNGSIKMGGEMMVNALQTAFRFAELSFYMSFVGIISKAATSIPYIGPLLGPMLGMVEGGISAFTGFNVTFAVVFFIGGIMLYILLPLTFVIGFAASTFRWMGMVFVNVLAAPIFCFNLIRSDGEGMIGRGERYLSDLARTAITPAVLTIGAIVFIILFNIAFLLLTSVIGQFLPILLQAYSHDLIISTVFGIILLSFAVILLWVAQMLTSLCSAEFVQAVEHAIGEGIQRMSESSPTAEIRQAMSAGGQQIGGVIQKAAAGPAGAGK